MHHKPDPVTEALDAAIRRQTTYPSWAAFIAGATAPGSSYIPTLRRDIMGADADLIAAGFDGEMRRIGSARRAHAQDGTRRAA